MREIITGMSMKMQQQFWIVKFAPFRASWADIVRSGTLTLRGIRNAQSRNNLARMNVGDFAFYYHSQRGLAITGLLRVTRAAYPDPCAADPQWLTCDFAPVHSMPEPLSLARLKSEPALAGTSFIRQPRVAVHPLTLFEASSIFQLAGINPHCAFDEKS